MEFLRLKVSRFLSVGRKSWCLRIWFLWDFSATVDIIDQEGEWHDDFRWICLCFARKFAKCLPFWGGCVFRVEVFISYFFFLREKVSYIRYHEVFSDVSWLTSTHPVWVFSLPVSANLQGWCALPECHLAAILLDVDPDFGIPQQVELWGVLTCFCSL